MYESMAIIQSWAKEKLTTMESYIHRICKTKRKNVPRVKKRSSGSRSTQGMKYIVPIYCMVSTINTQGEKHRNNVHFDTDSRILRIDNCATRSLSPYIEDFVDPPIHSMHHKVRGINGVVGNAMIGTIKWDLEDDNGVTHSVIIPNSIFLKGATSRLLSPQHWAQEAKDHTPNRHGTWCATYFDHIVLYWQQNKFQRTIQLDKHGSNVATIRTAPGYTAYHAFCDQADSHEDRDAICFDANLISDSESDTDSVSDEYDYNDDDASIRHVPLTTDFSLTDENQTPHAKLPVVIDNEEELAPSNKSAEFLQWHHRLGHISAKKIRIMANQGFLPKYLAECKVPLCTSCLYGKATRRPWRTKGATNDNDQYTITRPGECVSIDQLESTTPGLIAQLRGIPTTLRYKVATVFVDHATRYGYVHLQKSTSAEETIKGKLAFEQHAASNGIKVTHYHADNGIFADNKFRQAVSEAGQTLSFCGVNAHFQNGMAERRIRELQDHARTMLIHAQKRWPTAITTNLWPYALRMANDIMNDTPNLVTHHIPTNDFTKSNIAVNPKHWHTFGCPMYTLDTSLQSGKKIDKWTSRSNVGIHIGHSPQHARTVHLVLSLKTGLASPQFHIKCDDKFETIRTVYDGNPPKSLWQEKCHFTRTSQITEKIKTSQVTLPSQNVSTDMSKISLEQVNNNLSTQLDNVTINTKQRKTPKNTLPMQPPAGAKASEGVTDAPTPTPNIKTTVLRSGRISKPPDRLINAYACELQQSEVPYEIFASICENDERGWVAYAASKDPDTMYLHQAMQQPDKDQFLEAMVKEVEGQMSNGNFAIVHIDEVPQGATILPAVWAMRRKRRIGTGEIYKWKARLNIDGSKQTKGVNFWDTYAPVASWLVIRLILILIITRRWKTRQIDYVQAYTQADAETDLLYMKIPKGFTIQHGSPRDYVLRINKNIYGQKQAGRVWNQHLVKRLAIAGFKQSKVDECVFYKGKCIYVLYTDDSILAGPSDEELDQAIKDIKAAGLEITVENQVDEFLGVKIIRRDDNTIEMTQPQLINQILKDLHLEKDNVAIKQTPAASTGPLRRHSDQPAFDNHFDYRSIVGKLNYLEKSTRPDISVAVHQCARFVSDPKQQHGKAINWLARYLKGTAKQGMIFKPDVTKSIDCYVDADFSGNWDKIEAPDDSDTARSRTGYMITYAGCPLVWASKLQSHIALSSTEAEYIALSTAMRDVIPLIELLKEMKHQGFHLLSTVPNIHCQVFEDNSGAIELATVQKYRPRTKHINTQYHHFRHYVDKKEVLIQHIGTEEQQADMLTKPLSKPLFLKHRQATMGW
jgi:Reverse transcriptase (RNA-dependent DNA polymerase)/GAG-pre-integrase domain